MKKYIKIIIAIVSLSIIIDIISIYTRDKPIFIISNNHDNKNMIYRGLLYDTYKCDAYQHIQIKAKWEKYKCPIETEIEIKFDIIDKTTTCDEALEKFYEDEYYEYYFPCMKNDTTFLNFGKNFSGEDVIYTVKESLERKMVTIKQLEEKGLEFIKKNKV